MSHIKKDEMTAGLPLRMRIVPQWPSAWRIAGSAPWKTSPVARRTPVGPGSENAVFGWKEVKPNEGLEIYGNLTRHFHISIVGLDELDELDVMSPWPWPFVLSKIIALFHEAISAQNLENMCHDCKTWAREMWCNCFPLEIWPRVETWKLSWIGRTE